MINFPFDANLQNVQIFDRCANKKQQKEIQEEKFNFPARKTKSENKKLN